MRTWVNTRLTLFDDWVNVTVYRRGRFDVRRIDIIVTIFGIICVTYYGAVGGWMGALTGLLAYIFFVMIALWILR